VLPVRSGDLHGHARRPDGARLHLIYLYDARANTETPDLAALVTNRLLIPPQIINRLPWSRGYLMTVHHADLQPGDVLLDHCFFDPARRRHVGLDGKPRDADFEPCGSWASTASPASTTRSAKLSGSSWHSTEQAKPP
jgi:hypothetical protein